MDSILADFTSPSGDCTGAVHKSARTSL